MISKQQIHYIDISAIHTGINSNVIDDGDIKGDINIIMLFHLEQFLKNPFGNPISVWFIAGELKGNIHVFYVLFCFFYTSPDANAYAYNIMFTQYINKVFSYLRMAHETPLMCEGFSTEITVKCVFGFLLTSFFMIFQPFTPCKLLSTCRTFPPLGHLDHVGQSWYKRIFQLSSHRVCSLFGLQ